MKIRTSPARRRRGEQRTIVVRPAHRRGAAVEILPAAGATAGVYAGAML